MTSLNKVDYGCTEFKEVTFFPVLCIHMYVFPLKRYEHNPVNGGVSG